MRELEGAYGRKAYLAWEQSGRRSLDLSREKSSTEEAAADIYIWPIDTFKQLVSDVAFLTVMNKRACSCLEDNRQTSGSSPVCAEVGGTSYGWAIGIASPPRIGRRTSRRCRRLVSCYFSSARRTNSGCRAGEECVRRQQSNGQWRNTTAFGLLPYST
jgi:hypothetical protein